MVSKYSGVKMKSGFTPTPNFRHSCAAAGGSEHTSLKQTLSRLLTRGKGKSSSGNLVRGFTLVELLLVISIISLLSAIVFTNLADTREKARDVRRVTDLKELQKSLELYLNDNGLYPTNLNSLLGTYISRIPQDSINIGTPCRPNYCYGYPTTPNNFHLGAKIENINNMPSGGGRNCNSAIGGGANACGTVIYNNGFDGTAADIYDITP